MISVPQLSDEKIKPLLTKLKANENPILISVEADIDAKPNECFDNVASKILRDGGERVVGWQFWQHPFMVEAEYHAVWKSPDGIIKDITPKNLATEQILFAEDRNRLYEGRQVDNMRLNITANQLVDDFIALAEAKFYIFNAGDRAYQKMVHLSPNDQQILQYIGGMMVQVERMITQGNVKNSSCFCNSGTKYKHCHGKNLIAYLNSIRQ